MNPKSANKMTAQKKKDPTCFALYELRQGCPQILLSANKTPVPHG